MRKKMKNEEGEALYDAIAHGDDEHKKWLHGAIRAFIAGEAIPPTSGKGTVDHYKFILEEYSYNVIKAMDLLYEYRDVRSSSLLTKVVIEEVLSNLKLAIYSEGRLQ